MGIKRYVQHKSGQGEKWEVQDEFKTCWKHVTASYEIYYLPKSEYIPCAKQEEWEDVTGAVAFIDTPVGFGSLAIDGVAITRDRYRLRKIDLMYEHCNHACAFIVERRKS